MAIITTSNIKSLLRPDLTSPKGKVKLPKKPIKK